MKQFIALAVAEKVSALMTVDYLAQRAQRGSREKFDNRIHSKRGGATKLVAPPLLLCISWVSLTTQNSGR